MIWIVRAGRICRMRCSKSIHQGRKMKTDFTLILIHFASILEMVCFSKINALKCSGCWSTAWKYTGLFCQYIVSILHGELLFVNLYSNFCPLNVCISELSNFSAWHIVRAFSHWLFRQPPPTYLFKYVFLCALAHLTMKIFVFFS